MSKPAFIKLSPKDPRAEHIRMFTDSCPVRYSLTVKLEISRLLDDKSLPLYPRLMHAILTAANLEDCAFMRMTRAADGTLGFWSKLNANFTLFHPESKTFSSLELEYDDDLKIFAARYLKLKAQYENDPRYLPASINPWTLPISMIPWLKFEGFNLTLPDPQYLAPVITLGRFTRAPDGQVFLPFNLSLHHAAADGYHASFFISQLEKSLGSRTFAASL